MSPFISVIIVNYNAGQKCVEHLEAQTFKDFEVLIIDNGSEDGSADGLNAPKIDMTLKMAGENLGFAAGNNVIVKQAKGTWLAFLNPDAYADPNWLEEFVAATKRYPDVEAFGSTQIDALDVSRLDGGGDVYHALGIAYRGYYGWDITTLPEEGETFAACGAGAFYKAKTFRKLDGFESRFFCYCEDVDLGYRLRLGGGRTIQLSKAVVYHEGSAITGLHSDFTVYHGHRNRIWLAYKNTPFWLYWPFLPLHVFVNLYLLIRSFKAGIARSYFKGIIHGYRGLSQFKEDRRAIQKNRKVSYKSLISAIEWSPLKILSRKGKIWPYGALDDKDEI